MPHLADDLDEPSHEVRALDVLVGLVEHDELVELAALEGDLGEELEQHDEQPEGLVLLHELVAKIDDHEPAGADDLAEVCVVVDELLGEIEAAACQFLDVVRHARVIDALAQPVERQVVPELLHDPVELADVRGLVADRAHEETPVAGLELGGGELERANLDAGVLGLSLLELVGRDEEQDVGEARGSAP